MIDWHSKSLPRQLLYPNEHFAKSWKLNVAAGVAELAASSVAVVGLARNCAAQLYGNLVRFARFAEMAAEWRLHIETNDNEDATDQLLIDFCGDNPQATFTSQRLGMQHFGAEFAGPRTIALAEYRTACQAWVRDSAADAKYVVVIDWDAWGGWSHEGLLNGLGWLANAPNVYGLASVSLFEHDFGHGPQWAHYDSWALRLNSTWDDYRAGQGGWKYTWLPPVGSPPVPVCSAFGGLAIYRTADYLAGTYDGSDCEHVPFHDSIARATGRTLTLNPSQRCIMHWLPEAADAGQHSND
jgi:hypothetical protein